MIRTSENTVLDSISLLPCLNSDGLRCLAVEPTADVLDRILVEASVEAARDVADMRRRQEVRKAAERVLEQQRLLVEDIDGCAGDRLRVCPESLGRIA